MTTTLESTPRDATHWSTRSLAKQCEMSQTAIARIWKAFALQPHRVETFKLSKDPLFIDKVRDIVGLYLNPPERALLLSVDEKSQIQALDRTAPILAIVRVDFSDYYPLLAVGVVLTTSVLFAAWNASARAAFLTAWALLVCTAVGAHVTNVGTSGMRRTTGMLAAIYALCGLVCHEVSHGPPQARRLKLVVTVSLALILLHHIVVLPINYAHLTDKSRHQFGASPFLSAAGDPIDLARLVR